MRFRGVPRLSNHSDLLIEVDELDQLFLQYFLSADGLFDEAVLQQVQHVGSELEVLDQTPVRRPGVFSGMSRSEYLRSKTNSPADEVINGF